MEDYCLSCHDAKNVHVQSWKLTTSCQNEATIGKHLVSFVYRLLINALLTDTATCEACCTNIDLLMRKTVGCNSKQELQSFAKMVEQGNTCQHHNSLHPVHWQSAKYNYTQLHNKYTEYITVATEKYMTIYRHQWALNKTMIAVGTGHILPSTNVSQWSDLFLVRWQHK